MNVSFSWFGKVFGTFMRRQSRPRKRQVGTFRFGQNIDQLEDRVVLSANPYCPPQQQQQPASPVVLKNGILTITPSVSGSTSVTVTPAATSGYIEVFYTSGSVSLDLTFKDSQVNSIRFDGSKANATSSLFFYEDVGIKDDTLLIGGAGFNSFDTDSCATVMMVGGKGDNVFNGGTGINYFDLGTGTNSVVTGTFLNEVDCAGTSSLDLYGGNLVFLGGTTTIYAEADSYGILVGTRKEFLATQFAADPDADCYIGLIVWC